MSSQAVIPKKTTIITIQPTTRNVLVECIVLAFENIRYSKEGVPLYYFLVADGTAAITLELAAEVGQAARPGDILRITSG